MNSTYFNRPRKQSKNMTLNYSFVFIKQEWPLWKIWFDEFLIVAKYFLSQRASSLKSWQRVPKPRKTLLLSYSEESSREDALPVPSNHLTLMGCQSASDICADMVLGGQEKVDSTSPQEVVKGGEPPGSRQGVHQVEPSQVTMTSGEHPRCSGLFTQHGTHARTHKSKPLMKCFQKSCHHSP